MTLPAGALASDSMIARLPLYAEDIFAQAIQGGAEAALISPAIDARLAPDWRVRGTLVAQDRVSGGVLSAQLVFYGWLLERASSAGEFVVVIRGTGDLREWLLDAEIGETTAHPVAGMVESGFWSIFSSMRYRPAEGGDLPAPEGLAQAIGAGRVLVTGHSMGSALATFLAFELADSKLLGDRVEMVVFASPRPGDSAFGTAFMGRVPTYRAYWWESDVVPKVPFGFGYEPLPGSIELSPSSTVRICSSLTCAHHCLSYASMLDPTTLGSFSALEQDQPFLRCLTSV